jgi:hypothetical protein
LTTRTHAGVKVIQCHFDYACSCWYSSSNLGTGFTRECIRFREFVLPQDHQGLEPTAS